jgi:hypothetical protein
MLYSRCAQRASPAILYRPPCKAASKKASQVQWLAKPENQDYHRGPAAVARVQAWRRAHPGYSRRKERANAPSDAASPAAVTVADETAVSPPPLPAASAAKISCNAQASPLQDVLSMQPVVLVGLIAHLMGSALQEDIASAVTRLVQLGLDIRGGHHECEQTGAGFQTGPPGARAVQLDRSSLGA